MTAEAFATLYKHHEDNQTKSLDKIIHGIKFGAELTGRNLAALIPIVDEVVNHKVTAEHLDPVLGVIHDISTIGFRLAGLELLGAGTLISNKGAMVTGGLIYGGITGYKMIAATGYTIDKYFPSK